MAENRIRFRLSVKYFPELLGMPLPLVKAESLKRAAQFELGELGKREHFYPILEHQRSAAAKLILPGEACFFLGDDTDDGMYPHLHADMDFFKGKKNKRVWGHTHGRRDGGLERTDRIAFIQPQRKRIISPASRII